MRDSILKADNICAFGKVSFRGENLIRRIEIINENNIVWSDNIWHIAFGCDKNYLPYTCTVMGSIANENMENKIVFHIITDKISESCIDKLREFSSSYKNIDIFVFFINVDIIEKLPQSERWN